MTIRDLIEQDVDIDVYDDVCEDLGIAFCGPQPLTEEGKKKFEEILDYPIVINFHSYGDMPAAIVQIEQFDDWKKRLGKVMHFFYAAAGYCAVDDYELWFGKDGEGDGQEL